MGIKFEHKSLADYTSWRVGGVADCLYRPSDVKDLSHFLATLPMIQQVTFLGLGSNTLVRDGGVRGAVILTLKAFTTLKRLNDTLIYVGAGISCGQLARFAARQQLSGLEFFAGIPGTVGGALAMNAGCFGAETWSFVRQVNMIDRAGNCFELTPSDFKIGYRQISCKREGWFVGAHFQLLSGNKTISLEQIQLLLAKRYAAQPTNLPSCGSVFRNPPGDFAGRLIAASGLQGVSIGGASVSHKHANFIVNHGRATAEDIERLIDHVAQVVLAKQGVRLLKEVHIIGEKL